MYKIKRLNNNSSDKYRPNLGAIFERVAKFLLDQQIASIFFFCVEQKQ